mgnify:CR=1 FL=1
MMKKLKKTPGLLIALLLLLSAGEGVKAQLDTFYIVRAYTVDNDGNGMSDGMEFEFNQPVDDASFFDAVDANDWKFSSHSDLSNPTSNNSVDFFTDVTVIASSSDANDKYVRLYFNNQSEGEIQDNAYETLYYGYTYSSSDKILAYHDNAVYLNSDRQGSGEDKSAAEILSVVFIPGDGATLGSGSMLEVNLEVARGEDAIEPDLVADTLLINGKTIPADSLSLKDADYYSFNYWIEEGDDDISDASEAIPIYFTLEDVNGNISTPYETNTEGDSPGIDAHTPKISSVVFNPGNGNVLGIGETVTLDIYEAYGEKDLDIHTLTVNGEDVSASFSQGSSSGLYHASYTISDTDTDIPDGTILPFEVILSDGTNVSAPFNEDSLASDITPGVDADAPSISTVSFTPAGGTALKVGDDVLVEVTEGDGETSLEFTNFTVNGVDVRPYVADSGNGKYSSVYTIEEGDPSIDDATEVIPFTITLSDGSNDDTYTQSGWGPILTPGVDATSPVINSVELKASSKKIGDTDTLYINIAEDLDAGGYVLGSGKVAGYPLFGLEKMDNFTLRAFFLVTARSYDIDTSEMVSVSNLQLIDGAGNTSNTITTEVTNDNHAIFSKYPTADFSGSGAVCEGDTIEMPVYLSGYPPFTIQYDDGTGPVTINDIYAHSYQLKIKGDAGPGSPRDYNIVSVEDATGNVNTATEGPYSLTVHTLPDAQFLSPTDGNTFDVTLDSIGLSANPVGGDFAGNAVIPAYNMFDPSLAGVGDHELYYHYVDNTTGCADSDTITVSVIEGGTITFLQGKEIYCIYEESFRVAGYNEYGTPGVFTLKSGNTGAITDFGNDTASIDPTQLTAGSYVIVYTYGPESVELERSFSVEEVSSAITFTAIGDQCDVHPKINIEAKNLSPLGGQGYFTLSEPSIDLHPTNNGNNIYISKDSLSPGGYTMEYYYLTVNGCSSDTIPESFTVHSQPSVTLTMEDLYDINGGTEVISGDPLSPPGSFSPSFMIDQGNGTAIFDPELADLGDHKAFYTYTDANGCTDLDSAEFTVDKAQGDIYGLDEYNGDYQYCYFNSQSDTLWAEALNGDGTAGEFFIDNVPVTDVVGEDSIAFHPTAIGAGDHELRFSYTNDDVTYSIVRTFNVDSIGQLNIIGLGANYCEDDDREIELTGVYPGDPGIGVFSGTGMVSNKFTPSNAQLGANIITYTFTRDYSSCVKSTTATTTINKVPEFDFSLDKTCINGQQDSVLFTSDTLMSDNVVSWEWLVDNTVTTRTSNKLEPKFSMVEQVRNYVSLTLTTDRGCTANRDSSLFIGSVVALDFSWDNECHGETVHFTVESATDPAGVDSIKWYFGGVGLEDISDIYAPSYTYDEPGGYDVKYEEYTGNCGVVSVTKKLTVRPSIALNEALYFEDFEQGPDVSGWAPDIQLSTDSLSWEWGNPVGTVIDEPGGGENAYVTNLSGTYYNSEKSMVTSPCFDFRGLEKPMISFDYVSDLELNKDGVILEYSIAKDEWNSLGVYGEGVNWYNSFGIGGNVLGQSSGWTGNGRSLNAEDTSSWNNARYWLDDIANQAGVRFRFVLGTDNSSKKEGFAFDNISIGERNRLVVLEHFTNPAEKDYVANQQLIRTIAEDNQGDVVAVQYYTSFPAMNDFSEFYAAGPSARSLFYGISQVPYSIVDGGDRKFNYSSTNTLEGTDIKRRMLEHADFKIDLQQGMTDGVLNIAAEVTALEEHEEMDLSVRMLVVERNVNSNGKTYHNVVRTMLPDPAGSLLERSWNTGDRVLLYQSWNVPEGVLADSLFTVAFIQNEDSKDIYQSAAVSDFGEITGVDDIIQGLEDMEFVLYPNPASTALNVKFVHQLDGALQVRIFNSTGRLMQSAQMNEGDYILHLDIADMPAGIYYVQLHNNRSFMQTRKFIKTE